MQGIEWRSHSELLRAIHNVADGSFRLALWVKIDEKNKKWTSPDLLFSEFLYIL